MRSQSFRMDHAAALVKIVNILAVAHSKMPEESAQKKSFDKMIQAIYPEFNSWLRVMPRVTVGLRGNHLLPWHLRMYAKLFLRV